MSGQPIVAVVSGDPLSLSFDTIPGETYKLESTTDLFAVPVIWKLVPPYIVATGSRPRSRCRRCRTEFRSWRIA